MLEASLVTHATNRAKAIPALSPRIARLLFMLAVGAGVLVGFAAQDATSTAQAMASAGPDLIRLLRFMAALKSLLLLGIAGAVWWRLNAAISAVRFAAYTGLSASMAAGLSEIWGIAHAGFGALLLHGDLAASAILLYRDPTLHRQLALAVARRTGAYRNEAEM